MFMRGKPMHREALVRQGAVPVILMSIKIHHIDASYLIRAVAVLNGLVAHSQQARLDAISAMGLAAVLKCLETHMRHEELCVQACVTIAALLSVAPAEAPAHACLHASEARPGGGAGETAKAPSSVPVNQEEEGPAVPTRLPLAGAAPSPSGSAMSDMKAAQEARHLIQAESTILIAILDTQPTGSIACFVVALGSAAMG